MLINLTIPGNPVAQKRHRSTRRGKFIHQYDPSQSDKADFLSLCMAKRPEKPALGIVVLSAYFFMPVPKSYPAHFQRMVADYDECQDGGPHVHKDAVHLKRPDIDNLLKLIMDSLNGIYWKDDSQVQINYAWKMYSHVPRTELAVYFE